MTGRAKEPWERAETHCESQIPELRGRSACLLTAARLICSPSSGRVQASEQALSLSGQEGLTIEVWAGSLLYPDAFTFFRSHLAQTLVLGLTASQQDVSNGLSQSTPQALNPLIP